MKLIALVRDMGSYSSRSWDLLGVYSTHELAEEAERADRRELEEQSNTAYGRWLKHSIPETEYRYIEAELDAIGKGLSRHP